MKIAIYLHAYVYSSALISPVISNMDFRNPQLGNPGVGGTEYEFVMLAYALADFSDAEVNLYIREATSIYPDRVNVRTFNDSIGLIAQVKADGNDLLVLRADSSPDFCEIYDRARDAGIKTIAWSHNFMPYDLMSRLAKNSAVKRVVMVSHEHYDHSLDHTVMKKAAYIHNMFDGRHFAMRDYPAEPAVTYTGGLYKSKGFHVLASMWKDILREVPDAKLYVIGSGRLYNKKAVLGPYGLAGKYYEPMFMKHLTENGKVFPSVRFLGTMGAEKTEIYYKTTVGVVMNIVPETFGLVALDVQSCGVPVVAMAGYGFFETVKHGVTGYLGRNYDEIKKYIILLLKDEELNIRLGRQAKEFVEKTFLPEVIVKQWLKLFDDVLNDRPCEYIPPSEFRNYDFKRLKIANRWLHEHHIPFPPVSALNVKVLLKRIMPGPYNLLKKLLKH